MRVYYTRYVKKEKEEVDLVANYPEKLMNGVNLWGMVENIPLSFQIVYSNGNTFIYDYSLMGEDKNIRKMITYILSHKATAYVSKIEMRILTEKEELLVELEGLRKGKKYQESLFKRKYEEKDIIKISSKKPVLKITEEILNKYHTLLEKNYDSFYSDVKDR